MDPESTFDSSTVNPSKRRKLCADVESRFKCDDDDGDGRKASSVETNRRRGGALQKALAGWTDSEEDSGV